VRKSYQWQVLRFSPFGQSQISGNLETIR
jgi:hypothetical protein